MIQFKFELIPEEGVVDPYIKPYGYIFRAVLMDWLNEIAPKLVHKLHEYNKIRPYSIQIEYRKKSIIFYLNVFDSKISTPLINDLINKDNKSFLVSDKEFQVKKVLFTEISLIDYVDHAKPVKNFQLTFREPTYFNTSRGKIVIRLPIPDLIYNNLANLWNALADVSLKLDKEGFIDWINSKVYPSSLDIKTASKEMGESVPAVGFVGWVRFSVAAYHKYFTKIIDTLCKFGTLSNLGKGRTAGLGVIDYSRLEAFKNDEQEEEIK